MTTIGHDGDAVARSQRRKYYAEPVVLPGLYEILSYDVIIVAEQTTLHRAIYVFGELFMEGHANQPGPGPGRAVAEHVRDLGGDIESCQIGSIVIAAITCKYPRRLEDLLRWIYAAAGEPSLADLN